MVENREAHHDAEAQRTRFRKKLRSSGSNFVTVKGSKTRSLRFVEGNLSNSPYAGTLGKLAAN